VKELVEAAEAKAAVTWLERDLNTKSARIVRVPARDEIDVPVAEQMIVELYSR
jgi:small subunit ribosomal protein S4